MGGFFDNGTRFYPIDESMEMHSPEIPRGSDYVQVVIPGIRMDKKFWVIVPEKMDRGSTIRLISERFPYSNVLKVSKDYKFNAIKLDEFLKIMIKW